MGGKQVFRYCWGHTSHQASAMEKRRVLLVCSQDLFGEGVERVLRLAQDIDLIGPCDLKDCDSARILKAHPDVVVIADEMPHSDAITHLMTTVIEQCPDVPVIWAGLTENVVRVFCTHLLPARGSALLESIRALAAWERCTARETRDS